MYVSMGHMLNLPIPAILDAYINHNIYTTFLLIVTTLFLIFRKDIIQNGTDISSDASDVILLTENMGILCELFNIGSKTIRIIKENLFWALFYNACMIPLATGLFPWTINPMLASLAMTLSSFTVVVNSLRLL